MPDGDFRVAQNIVAKRFSADENEKVERMDMLQSFIKHGLSEEEAVAESLIQMWVLEPSSLHRSTITNDAVSVAPTQQRAQSEHSCST